MLVVLKIGWCDRESNEMLILMLQLQGKNQKTFFTVSVHTGLQNTQIRFRPGGFAPLDPPAGLCPCAQSGPRWPLDPSHLGSVLPKHLFQFPCLTYAYHCYQASFPSYVVSVWQIELIAVFVYYGFIELIAVFVYLC